MTILWINLAIVYCLALFSRAIAVPSAIGHMLGSSADTAFVKPNKIFAIFAALCLVLVAGLESNIGDTFFYMHTYTLVPTYSLDYIISQKEKGFLYLQIFLNQISSDPQLLIFTVAMITNSLIVMVLYKYSRLFELSLYIYITSGLYIVSMNGIRQFLAGAILFTATHLLIEGSWKKYILVVFLASTVHQSALILIPIYFIVRRKAWTQTTFFMLALAILLSLAYGQLSGAFFDALGDGYGHYKNFQEGGANLLRVIVQAAPLVPAYFGREKLRELFPQSDYIVNLCLLGTVFMIISTQNWIFARFIIYFGLYNLILISWIVKLFAKREQKLIYYAIVVCYFIYSFYENVISLRLVYRSDYF